MTSETSTSTQRAVVLERKGLIRVRDIDIFEPFTADDLRIEIKSVGICGSDVHYYTSGSIGPFIVNEPMVLCHEASGVVIEVGSNVKGFKIGDRVCMEPGVPDFKSKAALMGMYNLDPNLRFWATPPCSERLKLDPAWKAGHGCLRRSVIHPASFTFKLPDHVSFDEGAMVEPLAVGMHAATRSGIKPGDVGLVIGAGPIGSMTCLAALASGCSRIYIVDIVQRKLEVAEGLAVSGKIIGINSKEVDLKEKVMELTDNWGVNVVFECSGNHHAAATATKLCCIGGQVMFVGCPSHPVPFEVPEMQVREVTTKASFRYANVYPKAIALLESGAIDIKPIITNHFKFEEAVAAFDFMVNPPADTIKSIIHL